MRRLLTKRTCRYDAATATWSRWAHKAKFDHDYWLNPTESMIAPTIEGSRSEGRGTSKESSEDSDLHGEFWVYPVDELVIFPERSKLRISLSTSATQKAEAALQKIGALRERCVRRTDFRFVYDVTPSCSDQSTAHFVHNATTCWLMMAVRRSTKHHQQPFQINTTMSFVTCKSDLTRKDSSFSMICNQLLALSDIQFSEDHNLRMYYMRDWLACWRTICNCCQYSWI